MGGMADIFDQFQKLIKHGNLLGVKQLVESGADVNIRKFSGWTPLMLAAWKGRTPIVKYLLSVGGDVTAVTAGGDSALGLAALEGECNVIRVLLEAGASVDVQPGGRNLLEYVEWGGGRSKTRRHIEILRAAGAQ